MNTKEKFVITINREMGSGGRTVGEKVAGRLGVKFYDKALLKALQERYDLTTEEIERMKGRDHSWWADFNRIFSLGYAMSQSYYRNGVINEPDLLTTDEMFATECEILQGIAESESCVIAGRSGFYVFREHPNHLSILIQASLEQRISRLMAKRGISREEAAELIAQVDKMRENYVQRYTGTSRYDTRNYDLVVSMDGKTEDEVARLILSYIGAGGQ